MRLKPESQAKFEAAQAALNAIGLTYGELRALAHAASIVEEMAEDAETYEGQTFEEAIETYTVISIDSMDLRDYREFEIDDINEAATHLEQPQ